MSAKLRLAALAATLIVGAYSRCKTDVHAWAQDVFRTGVELVLVDVQVLDRDGRPIEGLPSERFAVTLDGKSRRVVSSVFRRMAPDAPGVSAGRKMDSEGAPESPGLPTVMGDTGRVVIIAIDCATFDFGASRTVAKAAADFVRRLQARDRVAVFAYPRGPRVDLTTDHGRVIDSLETIVGQRSGGVPNYWGLRPADVVDITAHERHRLKDDPVQRACGDNRDCGRDAPRDAKALAAEYEMQAMSGLRTLRSLIGSLSSLPERKIVILVSAGTPVSDTPGGAPDLARLPIEVGRAAAAANVTLYALFIDQDQLASNSAEHARRSKNMVGLARDSNLLGSWIDQLAGSAGGTMQKVFLGGGDVAYARILREIPASYLLGVETDVRDRDGRTHAIRVKVDGPGATVRARSWVLIPKR